MAQLTTNFIFGLTNQMWRYEQVADVHDLGWEQSSFDDSAWPQGFSLLGFEPNASIAPLIRTPLEAPNTGNPPAGHARYFRTHFTYAASAADVTLHFRARCDDGAIGYLNGVELFRLRPPTAEPLSHTTVGAPLPPGTTGGDAEVDDRFSAVATSLVQGDNVLAVVVYQNATTSSDVVWGTELGATPPVAPTISDSTQPSNRVVIARRDSDLHVIATGSPLRYQWFKDGNPIPDGTNGTYTIIDMAPEDAGNYFAIVSNAVGRVTSRTAVVQYSEDTNGPTVVRVIGSATFDQVVVEFNEVLGPNAADSVNYTIAGLNVSTATLSQDGRSVILATSAQTPDTAYMVRVAEVDDLAGNLHMPAEYPFRSWVTSDCGVLFQTYNTGGGNAVSILTAHPDFPNNPRETLGMTAFNTREVYTDDSHDNYGGRLRGLFIPPVSGQWKFYLRADDGAEIWLNPTGPSANGRIRIAQQAGFIGGGFMEETPGARTSAPFPLMGGQAYYLEALYKEGIGGDYCQVAARLQGTGVPAETESVGAGQLGLPAAPAGVGGTLTITQQPGSIMVPANEPINLGIGVTTQFEGVPVCYQWQRSEDGGGSFTDVAGATGPTYQIRFASELDDDGDIYRCKASIAGTSLTSTPATLTVTADTKPPQLLRVIPTSLTSLTLLFSEPMGSDATDGLNYSIDQGAGLSGGMIDPNNPTRVNMTAAGLAAGTLYTLTATEAVTDTAGNGLRPAPTSMVFRATTFAGNPETLPLLPTAGMLPAGSLTERGFMVRVVRVGVAIANDTATSEQMLGGVYPSAVSPQPNTTPLPLYIESSIINYNVSAPAGASVGHIMPDTQFPGFDPATAPQQVVNIAFEAVAYLQLIRGIYTMGVSSDDGFRVAPALNAEGVTASNTLGEFNGGRGVADTVFYFEVPADGLYPMRLTWEQGTGGADVEWWVNNPEQSAYLPVNGSEAPIAGFPSVAPAAFLPPCTSKSLRIEQSGTSVIISWPLAGGGNLFQLQQTTQLASMPAATVWSNTPQVPQTIGGRKTVTLAPAGQGLFFRLFRPGPACNP